MKLLMTCRLLFTLSLLRGIWQASRCFFDTPKAAYQLAPPVLAVALWSGPRPQSNDILPTTFGDNGPEPSWDSLWRPGGIADTTLALLGRF
jgi:hypothetical protein